MNICDFLNLNQSNLATYSNADICCRTCCLKLLLARAAIYTNNVNQIKNNSKLLWFYTVVSMLSWACPKVRHPPLHNSFTYSLKYSSPFLRTSPQHLNYQLTPTAFSFSFNSPVFCTSPHQTESRKGLSKEDLWGQLENSL